MGAAESLKHISGLGKVREERLLSYEAGRMSLAQFLRLSMEDMPAPIDDGSNARLSKGGTSLISRQIPNLAHLTSIRPNMIGQYVAEQSPSIPNSDHLSRIRFALGYSEQQVERLLTKVYPSYKHEETSPTLVVSDEKKSMNYSPLAQLEVSRAVPLQQERVVKFNSETVRSIKPAALTLLEQLRTGLIATDRFYRLQRQKLGFTVQELAQFSGIDTQRIYALEANPNNQLDYPRLKRLTQTLRCDTKDLLAAHKRQKREAV